MQKSAESIVNFVNTIFNNKFKIALLLLTIVFGPDVYNDWQKNRAAARLEADRKSVDLEASSAGMLLASAWKDCAQIGIVNNMEGCATYQGRLLQEMAAPQIAKVAIAQRTSYYQKCERFYAREYCGKLLERALMLSHTQGEQQNQ